MKQLVIRSAFALSVLIGTFAFQANAAPVFGRYVGILRHDNIKRDQLAKLDFIVSREEGNTIHLKAVLSLYFGDFKNGDYVAYHFDNVRFNLLTQTFIFDQADQPITLIGKQTAANEFTGEFRSAYSGEMGQVYLRSDKPAVPTLPLMETIWGEYRGKCDSKVGGPRTDTIVQVYTYRSTEGASQVGDPFRAYKIKGFIGEYSPDGCLFSSQRECVWGNIKSGSYNFFENRLVLFNNYKNLSCTVEPDGLNCGGCEPLLRASDETKGTRPFTPPAAPSSFGTAEPTGSAALTSDVSSIQGKYRGYLHHEFLDRYQVGSLSILTYQAPGETGTPTTLRMSAIGTLNFGDEKSGEAISYRFKERAYPNPLISPQFVFSQAEADVDAVLQITSLGKGVVKGIWFSQLFGRVGTFEFRKDGSLKLPADAKPIETVSAHYESTDWEMDLLVGLGVAPPNTENPFAPLTFQGWTILPSITPKRHITGGSYDFYTGRIGIEVDETVFVGQRPSRKRLLLKKMNYAPMAPLPPHPLMPYRIVGDVEG